MPNPSPHQPRNLFQNDININIDDPNNTKTPTAVEPSPIGVPISESVASRSPTEESITSPQRMDHRLEYLIDAADAAFAAQSPMKEDTKFQVSAFPTQPSPEIKSVRASSQTDVQSTNKRKQIRSMSKAQKK